MTSEQFDRFKCHELAVLATDDCQNIAGNSTAMHRSGLLERRHMTKAYVTLKIECYDLGIAVARRSSI